ncbi:MAG: hypothetical protein ACQETJ_00500 [Bacteroidota bacterium]
MKIRIPAYFVLLILVLFSCTEKPDEDSTPVNRIPSLIPDYSEITVPVNIAPLNFFIEEEGDAFFAIVEGNKGAALTASSSDGKIQFSERKWKKLLEENKGNQLVFTVYVENEREWEQFEPFSQTVSSNKVDPYLYYRLLHPGYESWTEISIVQRNLASFQEKTVIENNVLEQNCVNCHSFTHQNTEKFLFHVRGSHGGTYFWDNGELQKVDLKTEEMQNGAVYPRWHPSGNYVAFSSNKVVQQFHASESKKIEVSDLNSSLVMYDTQTNEMMDVPVGNNEQFMDTYPEWSPEGKYLYFCRADQIGEEYDYKDIKYNLCRVSFHPETRKFGETELVFDASSENSSVSFPRISPDGKSLVFTLHDYGCFPIWHKEADLYSVDLADFSVAKLNNVNSDFTESYHSWSSNGRWLMFSSKRGDGLSARPYIAWVDQNGNTGKPFVVPQEDPLFYSRFIKTFNIPEFATTEISFTPGELRRTAESQALQAQWAEIEK